MFVIVSRFFKHVLRVFYFDNCTVTIEFIWSIIENRVNFFLIIHVYISMLFLCSEKYFCRAVLTIYSKMMVVLMNRRIPGPWKSTSSLSF